MITIQSGMLIALGFLAATLLGLLVAPAFWSRAVRLTTRRLTEKVPLTETEIIADRDRIRAEYAIKMHKLEMLVEQVKLAGARQQIEINRRDARVNMLEADLERLRGSYEEAQNARRVLEQTVADRLPRVEGRLTEAKKLLFARDREIGELTVTSERQVKVLAELSAAAARQQADLDRFAVALAKGVSAVADKPAEIEALVRAELQPLQARVREQARLLAQIEGARARAAAGPRAIASASDHREAPSDEIVLERREHERQLRQLRSRNDAQAAEVAELKARLASVEEGGDSKAAGRESRAGLRSRLQSLEAEAATRVETITRLREELVEANARIAEQAAELTAEVERRTQGRRGASRPSLADRVAQARGSAAVPGSEMVQDWVPQRPDETTEDPLPKSPHLVVAAASTDAVSEPPSEHASRDAKASDSPKPTANRPRLLERIASLSRSS